MKPRPATRGGAVKSSTRSSRRRNGVGSEKGRNETGLTCDAARAAVMRDDRRPDVPRREEQKIRRSFAAVQPADGSVLWHSMYDSTRCSQTRTMALAWSAAVGSQRWVSDFWSLDADC